MVAIRLLRLFVLIAMIGPAGVDSNIFANTAYNATQEAAQSPVPQVIEKHGSTLMNVFDLFQRWLEKPLQRMIKINQHTDISLDMLKKGSKHLKQTAENSSHDVVTLLEIIPLTEEPIVVETTEIMSEPTTSTVTQRTFPGPWNYTVDEQVTEQANSAALGYLSWSLITLSIVVALWI